MDSLRMSCDKWVRIMADYGAEAIWHKDCYPLKYTDIPISESLAKDLDEWAKNYNNNCRDYYPQNHPNYNTNFNYAAHSEMGFALAKRVKKELPDWTVVYLDEMKFNFNDINQPREEFEYEILPNMGDYDDME